MRHRSLPAVALLAALWLPTGAAASGDPTMPLSAVHAGMRCTVRSVVQGTTIATFDADVLDVVDGGPLDEGPRILARVSGPAVDDTGAGEGFSGSPMYCTGADGVPRVAGALSEGIGDYGNRLVLFTPIEQVLGQPVSPPAAVHARPALLRRARPLSVTTLTGLPAGLAPLVQRLAQRAGRSLVVAPAGPAGSRFEPQDLVPGASVSAGYAEGDLTAAAIGTVTYRDGDRVWAFGHPLDGTGRRSLFLEDAYVYGVIGNPLDVGTAVTYKLAAPGHELGTLTGDGPNAVAGVIGPGPPRTHVVLRVRDADTGQVLRAAYDVADETDVGDPSVGEPLPQMALLGVLAGGSKGFSGGMPAAQTIRLCETVRLRESPRTATFCNRYVGPDAPLLAAGFDAGTAAALPQAATFAGLHVTRLRITMQVARGLRQAFITGVSLPARVRAGSVVRATLRVRRYRGAAEAVRFRLRIPATLRRGRWTVTFSGRGADAGDLGAVAQLLGGGTGGTARAAAAPGPASVAEVLASIRDLDAYDGVTVRFTGGRRRHRAPSRTEPAYRDPGRRLSGAATAHVRVTGP